MFIIFTSIMSSPGRRRISLSIFQAGWRMELTGSSERPIPIASNPFIPMCLLCAERMAASFAPFFHL